MPLTAPELDDRTFDQIFKEARLRVPRYTPEWTDFNDSDPGITLLQLFAWLTEMMLYRMNQVPERNYRKFLQLVGLELRPAQPARAHLTFTPKAAVPIAGPVPQHSQVSGTSADGALMIFETEDGLDLVALPMSDVQVYDGSAFTIVTASNEAAGGPTFLPLGFEPSIGNALYLGFTPPPPPAPPAVAPAVKFPQQIRFRVYLPPASQAGVAQNAAAVRNPPAPPVTLEWEYLGKARRWRRLNVFKDETAALTREGYLLVQGPTEPVADTVGKVTDPRIWVRVRLAAGSYGVGVTPEVDFIRPNVVSAINLSTINDELLGISDGTEHQTFTLLRRPVEAGSLAIAVQSPGLPSERWTEKEDLLASRPSEHHFVLNKATGEVRFGNGRRGEIPVAGAEIVAVRYRFGGGAGGNLPEGAITTAMTSIDGLDKVVNERPAEGGANEQDIEDLKESAPARLRSRDRAVTVEDFTAIANTAGGVAKAIALPLTTPDHPGVEIPGAVTVVIVPSSNDKPPQPSSDLVRSVCNYLDHFRLIGTELFVRGPAYQSIAVEASVLARPYAAFDEVSRNVVKAIDDYLDPLKGRLNFGDEVYPTNLLAQILRVENVVAVSDFKVIVNNVPLPAEDLSRPIRVPPEGLCYGGDHAITVGPEVSL